MSRRAVIASLAVATVGLGGVGAGLQARRVGGEPTGSGVPPVRTGWGTVTRGDLSGRSTHQGEVGATPGASVRSGLAGTLTSVRAVGSRVRARDILYRVDDVPVVFFTGRLPQWRAFESGMADGPDVRQLEENLHAWGYLDETATDRFDWRTRAAIERWQKDLGQRATGTIPLGGLWFGEGEHVVASHAAEPGAALGPGAVVLTTSGTGVRVTVALPVGSPLAKVDGRVSVALPDGAAVPGRITTVGPPTTADDGKTTVTVTIRLSDPKPARGLDRVGVSVDFVTETRRNVLSVPVLALGAAAAGGFQVEVRADAGRTKRVPVTVGLFAGDRVEILTGALREGQRVVVPA